MRGSFTKRGRKCDVTVTKTHLKCTVKNNLGPNVQWSVSLDDVLALQSVARDSAHCTSVTVHHASPGPGHALTWGKLVLSGDPDLCKELNNSFATAIPERLRPKSFLVVINPNSGSKNASRIFHKKVAPLLRICNVTYKLLETRGPDDLISALNDVDLTELDGVLCVGGDGTYHKLVTSLVQSHNSDLDIHDPATRLRPLPFPIGIIPGGSGNYIANYIHGTKDPVTAAIRVVLGTTATTNIVSVHQGDKLMGYGGLLASFGLIGDMMHSCEQARWMGNLRYTVMPLRRMFSRRLMEVTLDLQSEGGETRTVSCPAYSVDTGVVDLCDRGAKLVPIFGDSALTVHVTSECPLMQHIKHLGKVQAWTAGAYDFPFIQSARCTKYRVSLPATPTHGDSSSGAAITEPFYLNLDGEVMVIDKPYFDVRLHTGIVSLFGTSRHT